MIASIREGQVGFLSIVYRIFWISVTLFLLIGIIVGNFYLHKSTTFPIRLVQVTGNYSHVNADVIEKISLLYVKTGFFSVNLKGLQKSLLQFPWLGHVEIRKIWPDRLIIILQEHIPVALWSNKSLLSKEGTVFTPDRLTDIPDDLPAFNGPESDGKLVLDIYNRMNRALLPLKLSIVKVNLSERQALVLTLDNGMVLYLGQDDIDARLQRFINIYFQVLAPKATKVVGVDLRYDNGFAVKWGH